MKLYAKNEYSEVWTGSPKAQMVLHATISLDSRSGLAKDLLISAVRSGGGQSIPDLAVAVCDLSEAIHEEWKKRGWTIPMPPMDDSEEGPVGFERR
jgi:hypothetical protein